MVLQSNNINNSQINTEIKTLYSYYNLIIKMICVSQSNFLTHFCQFFTRRLFSGTFSTHARLQKVFLLGNVLLNLATACSLYYNTLVFAQRPCKNTKAFPTSWCISVYIGTLEKGKHRHLCLFRNLKLKQVSYLM